MTTPPSYTGYCTSAITLLFVLLCSTPATALTLLSRTHNGEALADYHSAIVAISGNGRVIALSSAARNLHPDDTSNLKKLVIRDLDNGGANSPLELLPANPVARLSTTGQWVAYVDSTSFSITLLNRDTDERTDIARGTLTDMTPDGRYVVFTSGANDLVDNDPTFNGPDVYVFDRDDESIERLLGADSSESSHALISADGRYVVFSHEDLSGMMRLDRSSGALVPALPVADNSRVRGLDLTSDGRYSVFATNGALDPAGDTNLHGDLYRYDIDQAQVQLLTPGSNAAISGPRVSDDGRFVTFLSSASNLVQNDNNGARDAFLLDRSDGSIKNLTQTANSYSSSTAINADGSMVLLVSAATNLVNGDTNNRLDVFGYSDTDPEQPPEPPTCAGGSPAGVLRSSSGVQIEVGGSDGCLGPGFYDFGEVIGEGLLVPSNGLSGRASYYPGNYVDLPRNNLAFYRYPLPGGEFLHTTSFVDSASGAQVDMSFLSTTSAPQSFQLLELLISGRTLRQRLTPIYQEIGTQWTLDTDSPAGIDLAGRVFVDLNADGASNPAEAGLAGARVNLYACGDADGRIGGVSTDALGGYVFSSLSAGSYQLEVTLPADRRFSPQAFDDNGNLSSVIRAVSERSGGGNSTIQTGFSDCLEFDQGADDLDIGVLP